MIGREHERAVALKYLCDDGESLVTITGVGGIGKTTLALQLAADLQEMGIFTDGIHIVWMAGTRAIDDVPLAIAESINLPLQGLRSPLEQLIDDLRAKTALLLLDNVEHLLAGDDGNILAAMLEQVLDSAPAVRMLATSRERLRLQAERVIPLSGLAVPVTEHSPHLERYESVRLFLEQAQRFTHGFRPHGDARSDVAHICRRLDGMPLAIELAAAWTRVLTTREIAAEIDRSLDFLASSSRDVPSRHRSMRAVLDHSWTTLTGEEQQTLARLSVFHGGFGPDAARAVGGSTLPVLMSLFDKSLLRRTQSQGNTRYSLHEIVRQYAAERLAADPSALAATEARHTAYYVAMLQLARAHLFHAPTTEESGPLSELENLRGIWWRAAERGDGATLLAMSRSLWAIYIDRGWLHDGAALFGGALDRIRASTAAHDVALRASLLEQYSYFLVRSGRLTASRQVIVEAQECYARAGKPDAMPMIIFNLAIVEMHEGRVVEAREHMLRALEVARNANDLVLAALVGLFLGGLCKVDGHIEESEGYLLSTLDLCRQHGFKRVEYLCHIQLAELLYYQRRYDDAAIPLHDALAYAGTHRDGWMFSMALSFLAAIAIDRGNFTEGGYLFSEAITGLRAVGDIWSLGRMLTGQAVIAIESNNVAAARRACAEQLHILQAGEVLIYVEAAYAMCRILAYEGNALEALAMALSCTDVPGDYNIKQRLAVMAGELANQVNPEERIRAQELSRRPLASWLAEILARPPREPVAAQAALPAPVAPERHGAGTIVVPETGETLSPREIEVLRLLMAGASNAAIADTLIISLFTVKNHVTNILQKLRVSTRTQAAMHGSALGLTPLPMRASK